MKRTRAVDGDEMLDRWMDERLAAMGDALTPSSGFAARVMQSVETGAVEQSPIVFPWKRAVPGISAVAIGVIALLVLGWTGHDAGLNAASQPATGVLQLSAGGASLFNAVQLTIGGIVLAACVAGGAVAASFRLTGGR